MCVVLTCCRQQQQSHLIALDAQHKAVDAAQHAPGPPCECAREEQGRDQAVEQIQALQLQERHAGSGWVNMLAAARGAIWQGLAGDERSIAAY